MNIDSIQNGIVLDHIAAGKALQIYNDLHLDKLDCSVAIIKNVKSQKMGKKDILKIDQDIDINLDVLGYIDPDISVNIIRDGKLVEKKNAAGLIRFINDKDSVIALKAVEALGQVKGDDSYNTLISLLRSPRADMRAAAATALGALGDQKARAHIDHLSKTEQDSVVLEAMKQALSKLHSNE